MKKFSTILSLMLVGTLFAGCATLFSGTTDDVRFESDPSGADIYVDGTKRGTTPATLNLDRPGLNDQFVTLKMDGYEDRRFKLRKDFNVVSILNLGNVLFWGIDVVTGSIYKYSPLSYNMDLESESTAHRLEDLPRDAEGYVVIPDEERSVTVSDEENDLTLVFTK